MNKTYTISELASEFRVTPRTIRYYEELNILLPSRENGSRVYNAHDRTALRLVLRGKRLGLSINECKELLSLYDISPRDSHKQLERFLSMLNNREAALLQQQKDIKETLEEIKRHKEQCLALLKK